jgi:hypothetical protein
MSDGSTHRVWRVDPPDPINIRVWRVDPPYPVNKWVWRVNPSDLVFFFFFFFSFLPALLRAAHLATSTFAADKRAYGLPITAHLATSTFALSTFLFCFFFSSAHTSLLTFLSIFLFLFFFPFFFTPLHAYPLPSSFSFSFLFSPFSPRNTILWNSNYILAISMIPNSSIAILH